ncbi:MarR family winged helix-turn-helix transcriptional regulator [Sphingorhabdus sp. EL138]|uniref:MarR family winged helix-turn-helix transcriptional regulator n=1 Tax=Sphingorhabdus sp. EL138 TaxID=2073156 RepID=UPI0020B15478|nr:MarR family transcriptional regulator [Sphingorhabdus sp. EL138]
MKKNSSDYTGSLHGAALGARLRRLSEAMDRDASSTYRLVGIEFEQRWFGVLNQIILNGPMSVNEIAGALGITHVSVSQSRQALQKAGYVTSRQDRNDGRRREIILTKKGRDLTEKLKPLWHALEKAAAELNEQAGDLVTLINKAEAALENRTIYERVQDYLSSTSRP